MPRECLVGRENQKASREQNEEKEERKAEKKRGGPVRSENINSFQFDCPVPSPVFPTSSLNFRGLGTLHALSLAYDVRKPDLLWIAVDCCGLLWIAVDWKSSPVELATGPKEGPDLCTSSLSL